MQHARGGENFGGWTAIKLCNRQTRKRAVGGNGGQRWSLSGGYRSCSS